MSQTGTPQHGLCGDSFRALAGPVRRLTWELAKTATLRLADDGRVKAVVSLSGDQLTWATGNTATEAIQALASELQRWACGDEEFR